MEGNNVTGCWQVQRGSAQRAVVATITRGEFDASPSFSRSPRDCVGIGEQGFEQHGLGRSEGLRKVGCLGWEAFNEAGEEAERAVLAEKLFRASARVAQLENAVEGVAKRQLERHMHAQHALEELRERFRLEQVRTTTSAPMFICLVVYLLLYVQALKCISEPKSCTSSGMHLCPWPSPRGKRSTSVAFVFASFALSNRGVRAQERRRECESELDAIRTRAAEADAAARDATARERHWRERFKAEVGLNQLRLCSECRGEAPVQRWVRVRSGDALAPGEGRSGCRAPPGVEAHAGGLLSLLRVFACLHGLDPPSEGTGPKDGVAEALADLDRRGQSADTGEAAAAFLALAALCEFDLGLEAVAAHVRGSLASAAEVAVTRGPRSQRYAAALLMQVARVEEGRAALCNVLGPRGGAFLAQAALADDTEAAAYACAALRLLLQVYHHKRPR